MRALNKQLQSIARAAFDGRFNDAQAEAIRMSDVLFNQRILKHGRHYCVEFMHDVVRRFYKYREHGFAYSDLCRRHDISPETLRRWVKEYEAGTLGADKQDPFGCAITKDEELPAQDTLDAVIARYLEPANKYWQSKDNEIPSTHIDDYVDHPQEIPDTDTKTETLLDSIDYELEFEI